MHDGGRKRRRWRRPSETVDLAAKIVELLDDPLRRAGTGNYGRKRVENELAWNHDAPKLLAAYEVLWRGAAISPAERSVET
jgi:glycosyltransferase involved in cell wall biosynthesis